MLKCSILAGIVGAALLALSFAPLGTPPVQASQVARGKALFAAKGCAQCHAHAAIAGSGQFAGGYGAAGAPDLTQHPRDQAYLRRWLADPAALKPNTDMPDLGLSDEEITALVAFLNGYTPSMR